MRDCVGKCQPTGRSLTVMFRPNTREDSYRCANCEKLIRIETERNFEAEDNWNAVYWDLGALDKSHPFAA